MINKNFRQFLRMLFGVPSPAAPPKPQAGPAGVTFRATEHFMSSVRRDLTRRHSFADERVGFITVRAAHGLQNLVLIAENFYPVADEDYVRDPSVGAKIGQEALRKALNLALLDGVGVFHVHMHGPGPRLWFSGIDLREQLKFVPDFFSVCPQMPHGALVFNATSAAGRVWLAPQTIEKISTFEIVGERLSIDQANDDGSTGFYV